MEYFDNYKHLDKDLESYPFNIEKIAEWIVKQNYGAHRMVCALARKQKEKIPNSELSAALKDVANKHVI